MQALISQLEELFAPLGPIAVRRMFGGAGVYADGVMFALIADGAVYLKCDAAHAARFDAEQCPPFTYQSKARSVELGYRRFPDRLFDDMDEAAQWAREALAVAHAARSNSQRGGKAKPSRGSKAKAMKKPPRSRDRSGSN